MCARIYLYCAYACLLNLPVNLHVHAQSLEVQNFGALMLHGKITRSWPELPSDQYDQLRLELFRALARFSAGPKLVLNQLCRALVGVAFNTMPERWPNTVVTSIQTLRRATQDVPVYTWKEGWGCGFEAEGVWSLAPVCKRPHLSLKAWASRWLYL